MHFHQQQVQEVNLQPRRSSSMYMMKKMPSSENTRFFVIINTLQLLLIINLAEIEEILSIKFIPYENGGTRYEMGGRRFEWNLYNN